MRKLYVVPSEKRTGIFLRAHEYDTGVGRAVAVASKICRFHTRILSFPMNSQVGFSSIITFPPESVTDNQLASIFTRLATDALFWRIDAVISPLVIYTTPRSVTLNVYDHSDGPVNADAAPALSGPRFAVLLLTHARQFHTCVDWVSGLYHSSSIFGFSGSLIDDLSLFCFTCSSCTSLSNSRMRCSVLIPISCV